MNGNSPMISTAPPFVLRLSKDERWFSAESDFDYGVERDPMTLNLEL
jgi:hypothetical protein